MKKRQRNIDSSQLSHDDCPDGAKATRAHIYTELPFWKCLRSMQSRGVLIVGGLFHGTKKKHQQAVISMNHSAASSEGKFEFQKRHNVNYGVKRVNLSQFSGKPIRQ